MGRGRPALWSLLLGLPLLAGSVAVQSGSRFLQSFADPLAALGGFVVVVGLYVHYTHPEAPVFREDEEVLDTRTPNQRPAIVKTVFGIPFFVVAAYLLYYTTRPYVYPTSAFFLGLYLYSTGLLRYWQNALTEYHLTDRRLVSVYRFVSLDRKEIALGDVQMIQERKSVWEKLVGLGNVRVAAGVADLEVVARNIRDPTAFADRIRNRSS